MGRQAERVPSATFITNLFIYLQVNVVDLGYVVDLGAYSAPDQPHNPDQPHYLLRGPGLCCRLGGA